VMFLGATVVHEVCFQALYAVVEARSFRLQPWPLATQAAINGVVGLVAFFVVEQLPGMLQRRRARRGRY
jgi:hypothetical protein